MKTENLVLHGRHIRLESLGHHHVDALVAAAANDKELYKWSPVPTDRAGAIAYVETALAWQKAGTAVPFATVRTSDGVVIGSTRFWNIERWSWPQGHPLHERTTPDTCEIGY